MGVRMHRGGKGRWQALALRGLPADAHNRKCHEISLEGGRSSEWFAHLLCAKATLKPWTEAAHLARANKARSA